MSRSGATALFDRVKAITEDLHGCGARDREAGTVRYTFKSISKEAARQLEPNGDLPPDHRKPDPENSAFGNQLSYLHNDFNFDVARPIDEIALITHVSFIPVFPPKYVKSRDPSLPRYTGLKPEPISERLIERLDELRKKAIHALDGDYEDEGFAGGKDEISKIVDRFHSFDQPVVTTMRSIERMYSFVHRQLAEADEATAAAAKTAQLVNEAQEREILSHGMSRNISMKRDFALLVAPGEEGRWNFSWERHHSHYQTITVVEDTRPELIRPGSGCREDIRAIASSLSRLVDKIGDPSETERLLLNCTALDALPPEWASYLYGRFLQGANYLMLPVEMLFEREHLKMCSEEHREFGTTAERWHDLGDRVLRLCKVPHQYGHHVNLSIEQFRQAWAVARKDPVKLRPAAELALRLLRPLINILFANARERRFEFVMFGAAHGAAIVVSDGRNFGSKVERPLMSATVVIDLGMNEFERGRLIKHLTEFSTERFHCLHTLGSFRFFSDVLDDLSVSLLSATNAWMDDVSDGDGDRRDGEFIKELQRLTTSLNLLNSLVSGGILAQSSIVEASRERVTSHISAIGHYPLPGFMDINEFLERRYFKSVRTIATVAQRYRLLRERIAQLSALAEAKVEIAQDERQVRDSNEQTASIKRQESLLKRGESLALYGIIYYVGQIFAYCLIVGIFITALTGEFGRNLQHLSHDKSYAIDGLFVSAFGLALAFALATQRREGDDDRSARKWLRRLVQGILILAAIGGGGLAFALLLPG